MNPESLTALFNKDPMELTKADLDTIVSELRTQRKNWAADEAAKAANGGRKPRTVKASGKPSLSASEMDDLLDGI